MQKNNFYFTKLGEKIFKDRDSLAANYRELLEHFYRELRSVVPFENLHAFKKIVHDKLHYSLLPFRVWNHLVFFVVEFDMKVAYDCFAVNFF